MLCSKWVKRNQIDLRFKSIATNVASKSSHSQKTARKKYRRWTHRILFVSGISALTLAAKSEGVTPVAIKSGWVLGTTMLSLDMKEKEKKWMWKLYDQLLVQQQLTTKSMESRRLEENLIQILLEYLLQKNDELSGEREHIKRHLARNGALPVLLEYAAKEKPKDPKKAEQLANALLVLLSLPEERRNAIPLVMLGKTLDHLVECETLSYIDLIRLGDKLMQFQRLQLQNPEERVFSLNRQHLVLRDIAGSLSGYKRLLSLEMPNNVKLFGVWALRTLLEHIERSSHVEGGGSGWNKELESLLSPTFATLLLAQPHTVDDIQLEVSMLMNTMIHLAQRTPALASEDTCELWIKLIRRWTQSELSELQLNSALCLRTLSSHPVSRRHLSESKGMMESFLLLSRRLHELNHSSSLKKSSLPKEEISTHMLTQKHLSRAFYNLCIMSSDLSSSHFLLDQLVNLQTKRDLPMSKVFQSAYDLYDLPVIGAEEYESNIEFGWIDMLTSWMTSNPYREIRMNALKSLVWFVENEPQESKHRHTQLILQAWLMKILQEIRQITGEEVLAVKQVEQIAKLSSELTPGSEQIRFNPAVIDAGAAAVAVLAEQHCDELLSQGVLELVSLLATKIEDQLDFRAQSARIIANLAASSCESANGLLEDISFGGRTSGGASDAHGKGRIDTLKLFIQDHFDIKSQLREFESGKKFLSQLSEWGTCRDPMERSSFYRAVANMEAYKDLMKTGVLSKPIYHEGINPIVPYQVTQNDYEKPLEEQDEITSINMADSLDVVFIHGLRGHPFGTWRTDMTDEIDGDNDIWPDILLYNDLKKKYQNLRFITLGYEAGMVSWSSPWPSLSLEERARLMLQALYAAKVGVHEQGQTERPVVFITHSMGGLLLKKMLLQANDQEESKVLTQDPVVPAMLENTKGVVFLAVPHFGSDIANHVNSESIRSLIRAHPAIRDLCLDAGRLVDLNEAFKKLEMDCLSVGEEKPAPLGMGISTVVVKPHSANPGIGRFYILPESDHMTICKIKTKQDPLYQELVNYVLDRTTQNNRKE